MAFDLIRRADAKAAERLVPGLLSDPSVDLRREAVSRLLGQASGLVKADNKPGAVLLYRQALDAARDLDQIQKISFKLKELGVVSSEKNSVICVPLIKAVFIITFRFFNIPL